MKNRVINKVLSLSVVFTLIFQQTGFAQGLAQLDISRYIGNFSAPAQFRPLLLRYFSYDPLTDNFQLLLDKGTQKGIKDGQLKEEGQELLKYFLVGVALPDDNFWVNLRPDSEDQIINRELARTDLGKVLLEADLELKKDVAKFTSPETVEGREYWNKLYEKAGQIFRTQNITIPTLTRPWIVPGEVIIRENANSAYVYKGVLKVMLEQDHLKNSADYNFKDPRLKELNEYSSQIIREKIIPKLTKEVNSSARYAALRQVFFSLILSRWFKHKFAGTGGQYASLINTGNLNGLLSQNTWSKTTYFKEYQKSFAQGEYNIKEQVNGIMGPVVRTYFSGGISILPGDLKIPTKADPTSPTGAFTGPKPEVTDAIKRRMVLGEGNAADGQDLKVRPQTKEASSPLIRTELKVPEGQPKGFFTNDYHSYKIDELFAQPVKQIPDAVVNVIKKKLNQNIAEGKLLSAVILDSGATDIDIHVTHRYGELNAAVQRLILEAIREGVLKAKELGLLREDVDVTSMSLADLAKALRLKHREHSITERGAESVVMAKIIGAGIGAANIKLYHQFFVPGATPLQKLGFLPKVETKGEHKEKPPVRGFRAVVRRTEDVLKGNFEGDVWEFEKSAAAEIDGKQYPSVDESLELLALASQPNDFLITEVYPVEGGLLPSTEPLVSVVYQPVYGEEGKLRTLNPTFISRSQSGADAVAGVASMFYDVNFVPGGNNGERQVATRPATLKEARKAPKEGTAHLVVYGWQSKGDGIIPPEKDGVIDHVAINPPALQYERRLADWLASIMMTHQHDQPYIAPFAAQALVEPLRKAQSHLFKRAPKEADIDPHMYAVEAKVARDEFLSVTDDKADMGGKFGHNFTPEYMLGIDLATAIEAQEQGILSDGNIIGLTDKGRLKRGTTPAIGDDSHILMLGDKSRNSAEGHQLSFLAFTRGYLASMVGNAPDGKTPEKPYGRGQDFQGKEAKAAMKNPYFYSRFSERFFEILREVMPLDYMQMVENMYRGWKEWQQTSQETVILAEPFSGNVSQQGIGSARYLVDISSGEREFGILAGDKMGPAALNRPIREGVYSALAAGEFQNGLVFEIWDAKAFDEHGNIPIDELPELYADVEDSVNELKDKSAQAFVKVSYKDGLLRDDLTVDRKEKLAQLIKESGFVPTERIYLDAQKDKEAVDLYLADSDRFNIKQVWSKKTAGWDINNFQPYLDRPVLGSSVTKLGILAGGEYVGKDDPVMVGNIKLMEHIWAFLKVNPSINQGDMNGSHWLAAILTALKYAAASKESHPILVGLRYALSEDGKTLASVADVFASKDYAPIRNKMFKFNFEFKRAQLGGQFEPYGTNWRTVEASYPLQKLLRALQAPDSPFLVRNKPKAERELRPIGILGERVELFKVATSASSPLEAKRIPLAVANWKMAIGNKAEARNLLQQIAEKISNEGAVETVIAPSFLHIPIVSEALRELVAEGKVAEGAIKIAAQNMYAEEKGAFTGGTSAAQLKDNGVTHVILGHSEVRRNSRQELTGESNANVNRKTKTALANGLIPIVAVGESDAERIAGNVESILGKMVRESLADISPQDAEKVVIAYEPVWAIGTGKTATPGQAQQIHKVIRGMLSGMFGSELAAKVRIIYGGSVKPDNIEGLGAEPDIDGVLVGGDSLKADSFSSIVQKVAAASSPAVTQAPKTKVAINGFGRIGKLVMKAFLEQGNLNYEIVAVNDIDTIGNLAHLFKHDSTFGDFKGEVRVEGDNLIINGQRIKVLSERDPAKLPWKELGVGIVIESTGRFTKRADASKHLEAGAERVVISAPAEDEDVSVVLGVNEEKYDPQKHKIVSNGSCTTNCLAPVVRVLHQEFGIKYGQMQTTHADTNDQNVLDMMHTDRRRARASLGNIIPTTTGAAKVIGKIIPELQGKLDGLAMRVPTQDVSVVYLVAQLKRDTTVEEVKAALKKAAEEGRLSKYLAYTEEELVSSDFLHRPESAIVDASLTKVIGGSQVAVVAWYDNEWGYSNRVVELVDYMIGQESPNPKTASSAISSNPENLGSPLNPGGIDFRVIPMITQPMGNLSGLSFSLPKLSNIENMNLDEELEQIQKMLRAGITPSGARMKEFVAACYQKGKLIQYLDKIVVSLVDICKLEEEKVDASPNELKEVMLILDSIS